MDDASRVDRASMILADVVMVWWRRSYADVEKGFCTIAACDDFKRELKEQSYPENSAHGARVVCGGIF